MEGPLAQGPCGFLWGTTEPEYLAWLQRTKNEKLL